jgi:zinc-ribbon domain
MPSCPVCGASVPSGTQYCPACGTNLQQNIGQPAMSNPTQAQPYQQNPQNYPSYSYPQQGGMGMPSQNQHHGHGRYIIAIVVALIIGLIIGGVIGFSFPVSADYTTLSGTASVPAGTPSLMWFNSTVFGNLTSAVVSNNYLVNLPIGDTYAVSIQWFNSTGTFRCVPSTNSFTSNDQNATQDFAC